MKVLVTGGAGYIGSHTCKVLAHEGHEILVYDNLSTGHKDFVKWGEFCHGDILETQKLRCALRRFQPDAVIHFAAKAYVGESVENPEKYYHNNVGGTLSLLTAMRDEGIHNIVVSGTCAVYGQPKAMPISEDTPPNPINPYGESKLFMEKMLAAYEQAYGLNWFSLRYFNAAGCDPDGEIGELHDPETHLIPRVIMAALGIIPHVEIYGTDYPTPDGTCVRDFIHVGDLADAHVKALGYLRRNGDSMTVNLGTGKQLTVKQIISKVEEIANKKVPFVMHPRRSGDPAILVADYSLANEVLGWMSKKNIEDILLDTWNFFQDNADFFINQINILKVNKCCCPV